MNGQPHHRWRFVKWVKGYPLDRCKSAACGAQRLKRATRVSNRQMVQTVYLHPDGAWRPEKPVHVEEPFS